MSAEWLEGNGSPLLLPADVIRAINFISSIKTSEYELFNIRRFILIVKRLYWPVHVLSHKGIPQPVKTFMGLKTGQKSDHKKNQKPNTCTQIPLDSWRNWLPLPYSLYNKKLLGSFFPHLLFPFEFLREQLWTLRTEKWEKQERRCFSSYDSKQMSLWTLPRQVRG